MEYQRGNYLVMRRLLETLIVVLLFSCSDAPEIVIQDPFQGYFPLQTGTFHIYDVEDIQIQQNVQTRSFYQLKTLAVDSFKNEEGGYTFIINRYKRLDGTQPWTALDTWSARASNREVIVNEGNVPFVRLILPLVKGQKWNGNQFNTLGGNDNCGSGEQFSCDQFEVGAIGETFQTGGLSFENTLIVMEENDPDLIVKNDVRKKVYSSGKGLVYMEDTQLNYCTTPPACYGTQFVSNGSIYKQVLTESGVEK